jgi:hypothetical protein
MQSCEGSSERTWAVSEFQWSDWDERPAFVETSAWHAWPEGWDHDLGGVLYRSSQAGASEIQ